MATPHESDTRLAELVWRTVKLRVSLLILSILALLVIWSALINGNQEAQKIDAKFCVYLVNQDNDVQKSEIDTIRESEPNSKQHATILDPADTCSTHASRIWIESTRYHDETIPLESSLIFPKIAGILKDRPKAFADYDVQRRDAYRLQIHLSSEYSAGSVEVNALSVAEVIPFVLFIVLAAYFILGFQDTAYRAQLCALLAEDKDEADGLRQARTQFLTGPPLRNDSSFARHLVISPEGLATGTLLIALLVLFVKVVSVFILNLVHLTDTIFSGYPFKLYLSVSVLILLLASTRRSYCPSRSFACKLGLATAVQRCSHHLSGCLAWLERKRSPAFKLLTNVKKQGPRFFRWLPAALAVAGSLSLLLPWAVGGLKEDSIAGVNFAVKQHAEGQSRGFAEFAINPTVFDEMRFQMYVALVFLLVCFLHAVWHPRVIGSVAKIVRNMQTFLAAGVLFLAVNFLMYLGILQYETMIPTPWPMDIFDLQGGPIAKGWPLSFYNPAYGFWIFFACCLILTFISLAGGPNPAFFEKRSAD
jgi:hypothetical protein